MAGPEGGGARAEGAIPLLYHANHNTETDINFPALPPSYRMTGHMIVTNSSAAVH